MDSHPGAQRDECAPGVIIGKGRGVGGLWLSDRGGGAWLHTVKLRHCTYRGERWQNEPV